ncbi:hypothetical protein GEMRC1_001923 [Eukaryota sp. GEM-RC1]
MSTFDDDLAKMAFTSSPVFGHVSSRHQPSSTTSTSNAVLNALQTLQDRINQLQSERNEYEGEISQLKSKLDESRTVDSSSSPSRIASENSQLKQQVSELRSKLYDLESKLSLSYCSSSHTADDSSDLAMLQRKLQEERQYSRSKLAEFESAVTSLKKKALQMEEAKSRAVREKELAESHAEQLQQSLESLLLVNQTLVDRLKKSKSKPSRDKTPLKRPKSRPRSATPKKTPTRAPSRKRSLSISLPYVPAVSTSKSHSLNVNLQQSMATRRHKPSGSSHVELAVLQDKLVKLSNEMEKRIQCDCSVDDLGREIQDVVGEIKAKQRALKKGRKSSKKLKSLLQDFQNFVQ